MYTPASSPFVWAYATQRPSGDGSNPPGPLMMLSAGLLLLNNIRAAGPLGAATATCWLSAAKRARASATSSL